MRTMARGRGLNNSGRVRRSARSGSIWNMAMMRLLERPTLLTHCGNTLTKPQPHEHRKPHAHVDDCFPFLRALAYADVPAL